MHDELTFDVEHDDEETVMSAEPLSVKGTAQQLQDKTR
jgi:hypothetical protein